MRKIFLVLSIASSMFLFSCANNPGTSSSPDQGTSGTSDTYGNDEDNTGSAGTSESPGEPTTAPADTIPGTIENSEPEMGLDTLSAPSPSQGMEIDTVGVSPDLR